jgi:RNA polymerase sigma factor (sigma-70 family)
MRAPHREPTLARRCNSTDTCSVEGRPLDDADLVEQAQSGNIPAYEELVLRYQDLAFRAAFLITHETNEAEDVTQDAFVKAYQALSRFRPGRPFRPWLLKIVTNEARNRRTALARQAGLGLRLAASRPGNDAAPSPEAAAVEHEQLGAVLQAVSCLSETDQLVIAYRYFLDLSEVEMAVVLDCAKGTVKSRLSRALGRLRESLRAADADLLGIGAPHDSRFQQNR